MANRIYEGSFCSKCNTMVNYRRKPVYELKLGDVFIKCNKCGNIMTSGKKEYIMMDDIEKRNLFVVPLLVFFAVLLPFTWIVYECGDLKTAIIFLLGAEIIYAIYSYFKINSLIKKSLERTNDKEYLKLLKEYKK